MASVLEGIKVLDSSQYGTGPYATLLLSFLGAEVIKLEAPSGDPMRILSTFHKGISYPYVLLNLNKKCITLNLKKDKGREIFKKLVKQVDVLVENFLPGTMEAWGLSYETLSEINPKLIYASISGFGRGSKYEKTPAYDPIIQAVGGAMASTGFPGNPPIRTAAAYADFGASTHLAMAILAALFQREKTGCGQRVEIAMRDTILYFPLGIHNVYHESGKVEKWVGNRMVGVAPYNVYPAKDGYVYILGLTDVQAKEVMKVIGREDFINSEKYCSPYTRWRNREEIDRMVEAWTKSRTKQEIYEEMTRRDIPCSPVLDVEEVWNDEDLLQRGMIIELDQPGIGKVKVLGSPIKLPPPIDSLKPAPLLGQHNQEVYETLLGLTPNATYKLKQEAVI
jgi:crotonobetainyl-CoA:carnitine CoA-transferase CaiB-like acyl-CoA transferase